MRYVIVGLGVFKTGLGSRLGSVRFRVVIRVRGPRFGGRVSVRARVRVMVRALGDSGSAGGVGFGIGLGYGLNLWVEHGCFLGSVDDHLAYVLQVIRVRIIIIFRSARRLSLEVRVGMRVISGSGILW